MVSKQFMDKGDVEKTINENPGWQNLAKNELRQRLKDLLESNSRLSEDAKEYIRQRIRDLD